MRTLTDSKTAIALAAGLTLVGALAGCSATTTPTDDTTTPDTTEQDAALGLAPLPGTLNLLDGEAAGVCSGGVCHFPAPKKTG